MFVRIKKWETYESFAESMEIVPICSLRFLNIQMQYERQTSNILFTAQVIIMCLRNVNYKTLGITLEENIFAMFLTKYWFTIEGVVDMSVECC